MANYKAAFMVGLLIMVTLFIYNLQQLFIQYLIDTFVPADLIPDGGELGIPQIVIMGFMWVLMLIGLGGLFLKVAKYL